MNKTFENELKNYMESEGITMVNYLIVKCWWSKDIAIVITEGLFNYSVKLFVKIREKCFKCIDAFKCTRKDLKEKIEQLQNVLHSETPLVDFCKQFNHSWKELFVEIKLSVKEVYLDLEQGKISVGT